MKSELRIPSNIEAMKLAIMNPYSEESIQLNIAGHDITFGLPDTEFNNGCRKIIIPDTPHILRVNQLILKTKRNYIEDTFFLSNPVILLGHGKRHRKDPRTWLFEDDQNVVQLASDFNSLGNGVPPINVIISCRRALSMSSEGKTFKSTRLPLGWKGLSGIIFQKNGTPFFGAEVTNEGIFATATNKDSDFIMVTKSNKVKNMRKSRI